MTTAEIVNALNRQLEQHGYHLTDAELHDVAAQIVTVDDHPIYKLLSARLACIEAGIDGSSVWFYGNRTPEAAAIIRQWAADHADAVEIGPCATHGLVVDHRKKFECVVSWYPTYEEPKRSAS